MSIYLREAACKGSNQFFFEWFKPYAVREFEGRAKFKISQQVCALANQLGKLTLLALT